MPTTSKYTSKYRYTPVTDFYLDTWRPVEIPPSDDDVLFELTPKYDERPDLISYDQYGTPRLWWVFILRNMNVLTDPVGDFKAGTAIYIPTRETIDRIST